VQDLRYPQALEKTLEVLIALSAKESQEPSELVRAYTVDYSEPDHLCSSPVSGGKIPMRASLEATRSPLHKTLRAIENIRKRPPELPQVFGVP
jgi:hypothetical protein